MEADEYTQSQISRMNEAAIARGAPAVLVDRMLGRVMARPGLWRAAPKGFHSQADTEARVALRGVLAVVANWPVDKKGAKPQKVDSEQAHIDIEVGDALQGAILPSRQATSEACRRLLYVCVFAAGVNAHVLAHLMLLQSYRACAATQYLRILCEDELLLPLVQRLCEPVEWARCAACCRQFRALGLAHQGMLSYWLCGYSPEGRKEAMKYAIQHNVIGLIRPLIEANADVNCVFEQFWFRTPLHRAASRGHADLCRLLLRLRANSSLRDSHGAAPIHLVASKGRLPIVDILIRHDINNVHAVDYGGRTPCHMAALKGHLAVVKRILVSRGSVSTQALDARTPLDMALRGQHNDVAEFLQSWAQRLEEEQEVLRTTRLVLSTLFRRALSDDS
jgi:hypothetical protein